MPDATDRPSPAAALEAAFHRILCEQMQDMPIVNPALAVEAVGFRPWREHWLGVLVTPWFMNLVLMPRVAARWQAMAERQTRQHVFPAGVFEFIGARDEALGDFQACSLFSPMFDFADQATARATAQAALDALFDARTREAQAAAAEPAPARRGLSKRAFLLGLPPGAERGP